MMTTKDTYESIIEACRKEMIIKETEIYHLRKALRYYADKGNWHVLYGDQNILVDGGELARAALGEEK